MSWNGILNAATVKSVPSHVSIELGSRSAASVSAGQEWPARLHPTILARPSYEGDGFGFFHGVYLE